MPHVTVPGQSLPLFFQEIRPPAGIPEGRAVVLLHGFPEFSYAWRHQMPALAAAGFRAIAPDLRGYGRSPKPPGVRDYRIELVASDVVELIQSESHGRAHLVGHDWGGVIAWWIATHHPDVVERLVILNAPHPGAYFRELRKPAQVTRSWYAAFFQCPWLPEWVIRFDDFASLRRLFRNGPARRGAFSEHDIDQYLRAFSDRRALTGALNYYRSALRERLTWTASHSRPVAAPTLVIWGERDRYLVPQLTLGLERWVTDVRVVRLPEASHWVQHDEPARVNRLMVDFLRS
jgi:pimeloyl-ACP methyl ester carboxylesterase